MHHNHEEHHHAESCGCGEHHQEHHERYHEAGHGGCCQHHEEHGHHSSHENSKCGCGGAGHNMKQCGGGAGLSHGFRHFISSDEMIVKLENYLKELQMEAKAVQEHMAELKKLGNAEQAG